MKISQFYIITIITFGVIGLGIAAGTPVTHQFAGGDPASATQVNENFQELADRISDNPTSVTFDYRNYQASANSKTFNTKGLCGDVETRNYTRTVNGDNTDILIHRVRLSNNVICQEHGLLLSATPNQLQLLGKIYYDGSGGSIEQSTDSFGHPIIRRHANMRLGLSFGSGSAIVNTPVGMAGTETGGIIESSAIVAMENVQVPAGNYTACLIIESTRTSNGNNAFKRLSWLCPDVGEVKRIEHKLDTLEFRQWELSSIN